MSAVVVSGGIADWSGAMVIDAACLTIPIRVPPTTEIETDIRRRIA